MGTPFRRGSAWLRYSLKTASGTAAVALFGTLTIATPAHAANLALFCPPSGTTGTIGLQAYQSPNNTDRCAGPFHSSVNWIEARNTTVGIWKCAVLKPNSNGSGGNVGGVAAACTPGTTTAVQVLSPPRGGYSTIINQDTFTAGGFSGRLEFN
ncbi:hypothetical protein [Sphaerisporangium krabiense]|uniref:Secreted protein n=1 Tax=Sphaerisporangium krabiense TaxID=763782 RepID=A0A7W9DUX4_9ACTN|nr:hypothetical protein [Sphaerisporangium krabiense]MBB5631524.1 hypothetical protein [Sphaerisporangium krabiense]